MTATARGDTTSDAPRARRAAPVRFTPITVALVTVALAFSMTRLFRGTAFVVEIAAPALVAHVTAAACRFARRRLIVTLLASTLASLMAWSWVFFPSTRWGPFPTKDTVDAFVRLSRADFGGFRSAIAPVPPTVGFLAVASLILIVVALYADTANSFGHVALQAITCHVGIFFAATFFARGHGQMAAAIVMSIAVLLHAAAARSASVSAARWRVGERKPGSEHFLWRSLTAAATAAIVAATVAAIAPIPKSTGFQLEDLIPEPDRRTVVSPLVSVTDQLRSRRSEVLFEVQSPEPTYWRLTALDTFDGTSWSAESSFDEATDEPATNPSGEVIEHRVKIRDLGGVWLPAAPYPVSVAADFDVGINTDSSTLVTSGSKTLDEGDIYQVRSLTGGDFIQPGSVGADGVPTALERYKDAPGLTHEVLQFYLAVVRPIKGTTERLIALQNVLRTFTYDTTVDYKSAEDPILEFLNARRGYCQQFATVFAYFARILDVPSRVAIGFTYGDYDPETETYVVSGKHAHAWPEVWLPESGWTAFEPTPGRGNPSSEQITGIPAQQDDSAVGAPTTTTTTAARRTTTTAAATDEDPLPLPSGRSPAEAPSSPSAPWVLLVAIGIAAAAAALGWLVWRQRRDRNLPAAVSAWRKASLLIEWAGGRVPPNPTVGMTIDGAASLGEFPALTSLGSLVDEALYGPQPQQADESTRDGIGKQELTQRQLHRQGNGLGPSGRDARLWGVFAEFADEIAPLLTARRQRTAARWARTARDSTARDSTARDSTATR